MKVLLDMNLAPAWVAYLAEVGYSARHWSTIGPADAPDSAIMAYAREHGYIVLTHDLDFGAILATTGVDGPSVMQLRTPPAIDACGELVVRALRQFEQELTQGAIVTIRRDATRATVLPLQSRTDA